jgi:peptidoglycan/LPS O-acetylase OafA/YrhL
MILVSAIIQNPIFNQNPVTLRRFLGEFLFLQSFAKSIFYHTWSLAVEEHFYLLLAGGIWLLFRWQKNSERNPFRSIPVVFLYIACLCLVLRIASNMIFPVGRAKAIFFATYLRLDSLFFGVLLAYIWHVRSSPLLHRLFYRWRFGFMLAGIGLFIPMFFADPLQPETKWIRVYGFILCYLGGGALLIGFIKMFEGTRSRVLLFFGFLGSSSYPVYLWHCVGIDISSFLLPRSGFTFGPWVVHYLLAFGFAWGLGVTASRLVEFPVLRLRDRWFPSLGTAAHAESARPSPQGDRVSVPSSQANGTAGLDDLNPTLARDGVHA